MVDWSVARRVARFAAGSDDVPPPAAPLDEVVAEIEPVVTAYTGLQPEAGIPPPEAVSRNGWTDANLTTMSHLLDPVAEKLSARFDATGPFAGALRLGAGVTLAAEVGLVTGYMAQRVIGQYELSLLQPESPARLLFVAENVERAATELSADRESFLRWVAAHELTHALQFEGVPWLRSHLGAILREYLESLDVKIQSGAAGGLPSLPDPRRLVERFQEGGLVALVQTGDQKRLLDRMQAAMSVIEGHAEHVMDAVAPGLVPGHEDLRAAMTRRRGNRSAPDRILAKLLGFDMKLKQYETGKAFCDAVVAEGGIELLNRVWEAPECLPTVAELDDAAAWIARAPAPA